MLPSWALVEEQHVFFRGMTRGTKATFHDHVKTVEMNYLVSLSYPAVLGSVVH